MSTLKNNDTKKKIDTDSIISILVCCLSLLWDNKVIFHQETRMRN